MDITTQQQYELLRPKLMKGMEWIDDPRRTPEELENWVPKIKQFFEEASRLERRMRIEPKEKNGSTS